MIKINEFCGQLCLGKQGENLARMVCFNEPNVWREAFGEGTCVLLHQRSEDLAPYIVNLETEDGQICWKITSADVAFSGVGKCELRYIVNDVVIKSKIWETTVIESMTDGESEVPDAAKPWVDQVLEAAEKVEDATTHQPIVGENGNWFVWDAETSEYVDSGTSASGEGEHTHDLAGTPMVTSVYAEDVALPHPEWVVVTKNTIHTQMGADVTLAIKGEVDIEFGVDTLTEVAVDGVKIFYVDYDTMTQLGDKFFKGTVNDGIEVAFINSGTLAFNKFELTTYKDGFMTAEQSKKLNESEVYTAEDKEAVNRVSHIGNASSAETGNLTPSQLLESGRLIIDSTATSIATTSIKGGTEATINVYGKVKGSFGNWNRSTSKVYIDGVLLETRDFECFADVITMTDETSLDVNIRVNITEYTGGHMSAESLKDIDELKYKVSSIETDIGVAFDEIHEYAEALIGGDSE